MTEDRLKEIVPDVEPILSKMFDHYDPVEIQQQTEYLRKAVNHLFEYNSIHPHNIPEMLKWIDGTFVLVEQITGIPYSEIRGE